MKLGQRENILPLCFAFVLDCAARGAFVVTGGGQRLETGKG